MPLNKKGRKIKRAMTKQYGKKKGEKVFYAMENSGKLKKVKKLRGGGGYQGGRKDTPAGAAPAGPPDRSRTTAAQDANQRAVVREAKARQFKESLKSTRKVPNLLQAIQGPTPFAAVNFAKNVIFDPMTRYGRKQTAKGETLFGKAVDKPITRDYYRTTGKQLDVMSEEGKQYMRDAGKYDDFTPPPPANSGQDVKCPDGSNPPCVPKSAPAAMPAQASTPVSVSPTGSFGYRVGFRKGGMLRQGKPKLAKKGWK